MIKLLVPSAPPAVGVNENVAAADVLPATRSDAAIANEESNGRPPITPEACAADANGSALVCKVMLPPAVGLPMVMSTSMTVTALAAASVPLKASTVMTMELPPGAS